MKRKYGIMVLLPLILCALLLPGCKELFHPGSGDEDNNNSGQNGNNGNNGNNGQNGNNSALSAPTGLNAYISGGYLYGSWNAVSGAEWYEIFVSETPNGTYQYRTTEYETSYYEYIGTDPEFSSIYIKIRACSNGKESPLSAYFHLINSGYTPPPDVLTVTVTGITSSGISLSWNSVDGAYYYSVERGQSEYGTYNTVRDSLTSTSWTDNTVTANTSYYYKVSAYNSSYSLISESEPVRAVTEQQEQEESQTPDISAIPLSFNQWTPNTISAGISNYYTFYAGAGITYHISWNDGDDGTYEYSCDIKVSASINGVTLFSEEDRGYTDPKPVTVANSGNVIIKVEGYSSSSSGTYAIKYY
jgi:hypothetical protein